MNDSQRSDLLMVRSTSGLGGPLCPIQYEDPTGTLFELTQKSSFNKYFSQFETLANCIIGLPTPFLLSCFVSDLAPNICCKVQALQPLTLVQAVALERLLEEKFNDHRHSLRGKPNSHFALVPHYPITSTPSPLLLLLPSTKPPPLPLKCLSSKQMVISREKRLYFNCDEKYQRGHNTRMQKKIWTYCNPCFLQSETHRCTTSIIGELQKRICWTWKKVWE